MRKNFKNTISVSTVATILLSSSITAASVKADTVTVPENPRLWGQDRYETAVKVSQAGWADGSDYAIIASGQGYADALCAAPLAKANNAPILLTQSDTLSPSTLNELKRLKVKHIYIVGGQGVVSKAVEDSIKAEITTDVQRLAGQNRYETAVKVAEKLGTPSKIVLASGAGYADALSAAPVAAVEGMPILLTESGVLPSATEGYIKANTGITKTYVIGGTASVSDAVMNTTPNPERYGGVDRFDTNAKVVEAFSTDFNFNNVYLALANGPTGNEFADALSGAAIAAKNGNPVIITDKTAAESTKALAQSKLSPSSSITVIGGTANVPDSVVSSIKITAAFLSEAGKTYSDVINGNADITADNVKLTGNVKGDLYLEGNNASLSNITVDGTIYINPGENGVSNLDKVTAKNIVILSGAKDSIHLKGVKAKNLKVQSRNNARILSEGTTAIDTTTVSSQAILEATSGSFGNVNLAQTAKYNTVELRGKFDKIVTIDGPVTLKTNSSTRIAGLIISALAKAGEIKIEGNGTIVNIQVKSALSILNLGKSLSITGKIEAVVKGNVKSDNSRILSKVTEKSASNMSDISNGGTSTGGGGGGGGGSTTPTYTDITTDLWNTKDSNGVTYGDRIANYLEAHETFNNYVTGVTLDNGVIEATVDGSKYKGAKELFDAVKAQDWDTFERRYEVIKDYLNSSIISSTKVGNYTLKEYIQKTTPSYFDDQTGELLSAGVLFDKMKASNTDYDTFKNNLIKTIESDTTVTNGPSLSISLGKLNVAVDHITKDGNTIYSKDSKVADNVSKLIDLDAVDNLVGSYVVYTSDSKINLTVLKKGIVVSPTIKSIDPISATVKQGESYTLPAKVTAKMSDGTTKDVDVTWNPATVDTSTAGTKTFTGTVNGYTSTVTLTLNVTAVTPTYTDITADVWNTKDSEGTIYGDRIANYLEAHTTVNKYITSVTLDTNVIKATVDDSTYKGAKDLFDAVKAQDWNTFESRYEVIKDYLNMPVISNVKIGSYTLKEYIQKTYPSYFDDQTGELLSAAVLFDKMKASNTDYDTFKDNLIKAIESDTTVTNGPSLSISVGKLNIAVDHITKDGNTIYSKDSKVSDNISKLIDLDTVANLVGNYVVYTKDSTVKFTVVKKGTVVAPTISTIDPISATVEQNGTYTLPAKVTAKMSDNSTKEVNVTWNPATVDTSTAGAKTFTGTVEGYTSTVTLTLTVTAVAPTISTIDPISATVEQNGTYTLPAKVTAKMSDNSTKEVNVTWNPATVDTSTAGAKTFTGTVEGYTSTVTLTLTVTAVAPTISTIDPISATVEQNGTYTLPAKVTAKMSDNSTKEVNVTWNPATVDTSTAGAKTFTGTVEGYTSTVTLTLTVTAVAPTISTIDPISATVEQNGTYTLPAKVTAKMSDNSTKEVNVTWNPATVDTSTPGTKTFIGTVEGYTSIVTLTLNVTAEPTGEWITAPYYEATFTGLILGQVDSTQVDSITVLIDGVPRTEGIILDEDGVFSIDPTEFPETSAFVIEAWKDNQKIKSMTITVDVSSI